MKTTEAVFKKAEALLQKHNLKVAGKDDKRPWGGFLVVEETDAEKFISDF